MPKLPESASKNAKGERMSEEMGKFKAGTLHSGSRKGPIVKNRDQAVAISLSESGQSRKGRKSGRKASRTMSRH